MQSPLLTSQATPARGQKGAEMKIRILSGSIMAAIVLAMAAAAMVNQRASAACTNVDGLPVPCPPGADKTRKPTATPLPTPVPPTATAAACSPTAAQLAALCPGWPGSTGGLTSSDAPPGPQSMPPGPPGVPSSNPPDGPNGVLFPFRTVEFTGAGGLLVGILIGLLLPAVNSALKYRRKGSNEFTGAGAGGAGNADNAFQRYSSKDASKFADKTVDESWQSSGSVFPKFADKTIDESWQSDDSHFPKLADKTIDESWQSDDSHFPKFATKKGAVTDEWLEGGKGTPPGSSNPGSGESSGGDRPL